MCFYYYFFCQEFQVFYIFIIRTSIYNAHPLNRKDATIKKYVYNNDNISVSTVMYHSRDTIMALSFTPYTYGHTRTHAGMSTTLVVVYYGKKQGFKSYYHSALGENNVF